MRDDVAISEVGSILNSLGVFVGPTSGLASAAAKQHIDEENIRNKEVVVICPDSGNRYSKMNFPTPSGDICDEYRRIVEKARGKLLYPKIL